MEKVRFGGKYWRGGEIVDMIFFTCIHLILFMQRRHCRLCDHDGWLIEFWRDQWFGEERGNYRLRKRIGFLR